jgi:cell division topological specificity factor
MNWFTSLARRRSASVARERLQILLTHERGTNGQPDLLPLLREEVLAVVAKHVAIEPDKVQVKIERGKAVSLLEIDIEIPGLIGQSIAPRPVIKGDLPVEPSRLSHAMGSKRGRQITATPA